MITNSSLESIAEKNNRKTNVFKSNYISNQAVSAKTNSKPKPPFVDSSSMQSSTGMIQRKRPLNEVMPLPTELQKQNADLVHKIYKDRLNPHTIEVKLTSLEKDVLVEPIKQWQKMYKERDLFDVTKPVPYDMDEAYE